MALNYSHRPIVTSHTSEKNLASRIGNGGYDVESASENSGECFSSSWHTHSGEADMWNLSRGKDKIDQGPTPEIDICELLPRDPFGMDIITGLLEDLEAVWKNSSNCAEKLVTTSRKFSFDVYNEPNIGSHYFSSNIPLEENLNGKGNLCQEKSNKGRTSVFNPVSDMGEVADFENGSTKVEQALDFEGPARVALHLALGYLGVKDLLSVERVCRFLGSTVRNDSLLWRHIHIVEPLNEKITDDVLLYLTNRAQGLLQSLNLVECTKVTDDGLRRVLESNPQLTKLCVPGCTRISIEGMVRNMRIHNRIKYLRIGGLFGVTQEHYDELKSLLCAELGQLENQQKPHFYHRGNLYLPFDDDRVLDIEKCPMCEKFRLVYDCPSENCQHEDKICRACTICILRCAQCGRCTTTWYEETFSLELLCFGCSMEHLKLEHPSEDLGEPTYSLNQHG